MPIVYIDAPPGLPQAKKNTMVKSVTEAVDEADRIGDKLVFIRELQVHDVALNGVPQPENPKIKEVLNLARSLFC